METDNALYSCDNVHWKKPCDVMKRFRSRKKKNFQSRSLSESQCNILQERNENNLQVIGSTIY